MSGKKKNDIPDLGCLYEKTISATISPESGEETVLTLRITQDHIAISAQCFDSSYHQDYEEHSVFCYEYEPDRKASLKQAATTLREMILLFDEWANYIENYDSGVPRNRVPERSSKAVARIKEMISSDEERRKVYVAEVVDP